MRTKKMILNTICSLIEEFVAIICAFILPKLILSYYGSKYNGLITSITQFLACAVILRSGIGGATRAALYKPLAENNHDEINAIVKATDKFMKKIGIILLIAIMCFSIVYPFFVRDEFSWCFTFLLFIIIGISTFAESFFGITYLIILQADQKLWISSLLKSICYIINVSIASILIIKGLGIHMVKLASAIAFSLYPIMLNIYVTKQYNIKKNVKPNNIALAQRWDAFWHQLAVFVTSNTDVIVLTIFTNMYTVSIYSVYNLVINGLKRFMVAFTNGIEGIFGDMIAKNEKRKLHENLSIIEIIINGMSVIIYSTALFLILQFISIYTKNITDANYLQPAFAYILILSLFFYSIRLPYLFITQAAGHFKETKKYAITEVIINVTLSILLVIKFGLIGVSIGTLVSSMYKTIMYINYMSKNIVIRSCFKSYNKCILSLVQIGLILFVLNSINLKFKTNYWNFAYNGIISVLISIIIVAVSIFIFYRDDFKNLMQHFKISIKKVEKCND